MEYSITISGKKYVVKVEGSSLVVNGPSVKHKYLIEPSVKDLTGTFKEDYMAACVIGHDGKINSSSPKKIENRYKEIKSELTSTIKKDALIPAYIDQTLDDMFPGVELFIEHNVSFSTLLKLILMRMILPKEIPKKPYNKGIL